MRDLLEELWERTELTYISDLKGKYNDKKIKQTIRQMDVNSYEVKEWKDVLSYLGVKADKCSTLDDIKQRINTL